MSKKLVKLIAIMLGIILIGSIISFLFSKKNKNNEDHISLVTSFYPTYIIALNLADGISEINVSSLTDFSLGCLHDYQLTTSDMRMLSHADLFVMNGGGMESYLEDVIENYPNLSMVDLSQNITMLKSELGHLSDDDHGHKNEVEDDQDGHDQDGHNHGEYNPHVWLDPVLYKQQVRNLEQGLKDYIAETDDLADDEKNDIINKISQNADVYTDKIDKVELELENLLSDLDMSFNHTDVVIFHESFAYLAKRIGLNVAYTVELDDDTQLSAGEIAHIIDIIKDKDIRYLFSELQYKENITNRIEEETGATTYMIDSAVTGDGTKDSYLDAMNKNIELLRSALQ